MTRFKLVPLEPTEEMVKAVNDSRYSYEDRVDASDIAEAIDAAPEPSPEMVDELCRAMWGDAWYWEPEVEGSYQATMRRKDDCARMRAFLQRIGEQK